MLLVFPLFLLAARVAIASLVDRQAGTLITVTVTQEVTETDSSLGLIREECLVLLGNGERYCRVLVDDVDLSGAAPAVESSTASTSVEPSPSASGSSSAPASSTGESARLSGIMTVSTESPPWPLSTDPVTSSTESDPPATASSTSTEPAATSARDTESDSISTSFSASVLASAASGTPSPPASLAGEEMAGVSPTLLNPPITSTRPASTSTSTSAIAGSAAAEAAQADSQEVPGQKMQVLPIGLGVFGGLAGITLAVVGYVMWERHKYRKQFRSRRIAEMGQASWVR